MDYDKTALGSDVAHDRYQAWTRRVAKIVVKTLRLDKPGALSTEILQASRPIARIETAYGPLLCRTGHGRLVWRARTFFTEEPATIDWLDELQSTDVLWDVGANVGLYSIYAAKFRKCQVYAFEPESQNFALLVENMTINNINEMLGAFSIAVTDEEAFGKLEVPFITKGGAYNLWIALSGRRDELPETVKAAQQFWNGQRVTQCTFASSIDDLVFRHKLTAPSHIKIDVDGIEHRIIYGAERTLQMPQMKSVLVELNEKSRHDREVPGFLDRNGYELVKKVSVWDTKPDKTRQYEMPAYNAIFRRKTA